MTTKNKFPIKRASNGYKLINLGCGTRTHPEWTNVDFSPYTRLQKQFWLAKLLHKMGILSDRRWRALNMLPKDICSWNLERGIPFSNDLFDVVYHSHFLEHLNNDHALKFLRDCYRVCKPNGIIRIVVPDLQHIINSYMDAISGINVERGDAWEQYDAALYDLFDQMVRKNSTGAQEQKKWVAVIERMLRGGPEKVGELHRWMYDKYSLARLLSMANFTEISQYCHNTSGIPSWDKQGLDTQENGSEYKKGSLYMEGRKPS
jgi:SAM-dependent methyltransferase